MDTELSQYFTMVYGILDVPARDFRYVAAGHAGPLVVPRKGEPIRHDSTAQPIGLFEGTTYEEGRLSLGAGDRLYLYTDGVTEAAGPEEEDFGPERTAASLGRGRTRPLEESIGDLLGEVRAWTGGAAFADDVSVLGVEVT